MLSPKHKILIIEDEALVARELKGRLIRMGYEVAGIAYGREAVAMARETLPDLLLTDIHLKDGEDGINMALAIQRERDVPVVFLTAYSDDETVTRAKAVTPYGYIIKPFESRELQIAIDMAMYKFNIERELRATQQLLQNALTCIGNALVFVDEHGCLTNVNADGEALLGVAIDQVQGRQWPDVFSLQPGTSVFNRIQAALVSSEVTKLAPFILQRPQGPARLVDGLVGPMLPGGVLILRELSKLADTLEPLPTPAQLLAELGPEHLGPSESSMCQLLIAVEPVPPAAGAPAQVTEALLAEVSERLNQVLRSTDLVSVYGRSLLSVSLPYTHLDAGKHIAQSVLKTLVSSQFKQAGLTFSVGFAHSAAGDQQPFELFRRAGWALHVAQQAGGGRVINWSAAAEKSGAVTAGEGKPLREYHNVVLLWNLMSLVMKAASAAEMSDALSQHLLQSFDLAQAAVLAQADGQLLCLGGANGLAADSQWPSTVASRGLELAELDLSAAMQERISDAVINAKASHSGAVYLLPLPAQRCVYLRAKVALGPGDVEFLRTLVSYFAAGLGRFEQLPETLAAPAEAGLIYQSPQMRSLLESCRLVAPTDATVLINGESGTGKEMLARTLHDMSRRADKPYIIVDCGAVVGSLIESELFGHVKGAFTGADRAFSGRLKEADGGTLVLDEVGELPLDIQVKLLRYVQERQIVAVGSNVYETVDTRIIAATNKDLMALVKAGKFREDLYYRLNVFAVTTPPLRDRPQDILLLARHYLKVYAQRYDKPVRYFSPDAEQALLEHRWPGNIRELVNIINRAVILCKGSHLNAIHLGLFPDTTLAVAAQPLLAVPGPEQAAVALQVWLANLVTLSLAGAADLLPLGQWLEEDLILASLATHEEVLNRAAAALGVPESTLRRKVSLLRAHYGDKAPCRPADWYPAAPLFNGLAALALSRRQSLLEMVTLALVREIESRPINKKDAAILLGVSMPTYRRLTARAP